MTRWKAHGERPLHESDWVRLELADVELDQRFGVYIANGAERVADPVDGPSPTPLLWALAAGELAEGPSPA